MPDEEEREGRVGEGERPAEGDEPRGRGHERQDEEKDVPDRAEAVDAMLKLVNVPKEIRRVDVRALRETHPDGLTDLGSLDRVRKREASRDPPRVQEDE